MASADVESGSVRSSTEANFLASVCLPFLRAAQNRDGGWGFRPGSQSRAEPAAWALLALLGQESTGETQQAAPLNEIQQAAFRFLRATQLPDGSWPASPGQNVGCWATSLATWALLSDPESRTAVTAGLRWICGDWPKDSSLVWRMIWKLTRRSNVSHNASLRGWGWTPETASWVEPTAFALIALNTAPNELIPAGAERRCELGKLLIYDRMCPSGGWNCGNPVVYGVPGEPLVEPTVWALLALRDEPESEKKTLSLQWLEKNLGRSSGPGSVALAKICLDMYGRAWPADAPSLTSLYERNEFLSNVAVMAWAGLAAGAGAGWLRAKGAAGR
jgi:hypothetical protein